MRSLFKNKCVLITGGTGSFGSFIVEEISKYAPREVRIFSRDEEKQYRMQQQLGRVNNLRFVIGDVRDKDSLMKVCRKVDIVLHAAALKQIPSSEYNIMEVVKTNVLGAQNVVDACIENRVSKALAISTDKAVEAVNVMGMTKAIQERIFILGNKFRDSSKTVFAAVRYGNVVASRGSVIPLFLKQIEAGGPLTLTDSRMTRFILTLKQAIGLVFTALEKMVGGEVFVPKIKPIRIIDLASVMVEEFKPRNNKILEIGIRPGEKLHETLISAIESIRTVRKRDYFVVLPQIDIKEIGSTYKIRTYKDRDIFRYASDQGPFLTKNEIKKLLKSEGII